ncbi:hypothetical protein CRENBAI_020877 [Crenichthys baileyi]|uniref:Uncharacterized protein n=1 Tax=Crenichthys baileyi TaxID=28760 RepID=A0AAV9S3V4_9TELE
MSGSHTCTDRGYIHHRDKLFQSEAAVHWLKVSRLLTLDQAHSDHFNTAQATSSTANPAVVVSLSCCTQTYFRNPPIALFHSHTHRQAVSHAACNLTNRGDP